MKILSEQVNRLLVERLEKPHYMHTDPNTSVYVCRLNAFTKNFQAENTNRGKVRLDVVKQCYQEFITQCFQVA